MSEIDTMTTRVLYRGGKTLGRLEEGKLRTLKRALLNSYQSETAVQDDGREFRCLINPDKLKPEYDNKILSIPYRNTCINEKDLDKTQFEDIEKISLKPGSVFKWKETDTMWIIYLQYREESAYFRADIRKCDDTAEVDINGNKYKVYIRGPVETKIPWNQKKKVLWNNINYTLSMFITKNDETLEFFHRFQTLKIKGNTWEVQAVNSYDGDGIIEVFLKEYFNNEMEDARQEEIENTPKPDPKDPLVDTYIDGPAAAYPYDVITYTARNITGGQWKVNSKKVRIVEAKDDTVTIEVVTGRSGDFTLSYETADQVLNLDVKINSL